MSHVSKHKMKFKDLDVLKNVLAEKGISYKENCTVKLYGTQAREAALAFRLEGWRYDIAVSKDGIIEYDHFGSKSNTMHLLGETVQAYNKEVIMNKAWEITTNVYEEKVKNGIKITLEF